MAQRRREHGGRRRRWQIDLSVRQQHLPVLTRYSANLNQELFNSKCNKSSFPCYEVEFESGGMAYSYEINAATGAILKHETELDD